MNCSKCSSEIKSPNLTGELCTSCYFTAKNGKDTKAIEDRSSILVPTDNITTTKEGLVGEFVSSTNDLIDSAAEGRFDIPSTQDTEESDKLPPISKSQETPNPNKKYCQSCIERGYGLVEAGREWKDNYFLCDTCFDIILKNTLGYDVERVEIERSISSLKIDSPILNQFYDLLNIPPHIRFNNSEDVLKSRNDIFNYHAPALVNLELKDVSSKIEELQIMLFQIKIAIEPHQAYINRAKQDARESKNIEGITKSTKERTKTIKSSGSKLSSEEKLAVVMFPHLKDNPSEAVKMMKNLGKQSRETEFKKITGT